MSTKTTTALAGQVIAALRAHEAELREAGIRSLSLLGSVARGEAKPDSDVDLIAEFDPSAEIGLVRLVGLERRIAEILGRTAEISSGAIRNPRLQANIERDRLVVF